MSEYKVKIVKQRSRSARPYDRNNRQNSNLVDKVKNWLTPSSWLSYVGLTPKETSDRQSRKNDDIQRSYDASASNSHPYVTTSDQNDGPGPSNNLDALSNVIPPHISSDQCGQKIRGSTAHYRAALSLFEEVLSDRNENREHSSSSNESFVEEYTETEIMEPHQVQSPTSIQTTLLSEHTHTSAKDETQRVHSPASVQEEHTVKLVSNPGFSSTNNLSSQQAVKMSSPRVTTGLNAELSQRLYSSIAVATSTPQLSPVHERQEEEMESNRATSLFKPLLPSLSPGGQTVSSIISRLSTPARAYTNESLSRSPFRSPFYSGRTLFGGAASHQKLRAKRPRTESSPPVLAPMRVSVTATTKPAVSRSVVSTTARRIMDTLDSLTSPLSDARRIPMRGIPPEMQAKRRRVSETTSSLLSPPPIAPLHTSRPLTPQIVPNEKSSPRKSAPPEHTSTTPISTSTHTPPTKFAPKLINSQLNLSSSSTTSSVLSGLKFSAPPPSLQTDIQSQPPKHSSPIAGRIPRMKSHHSGGKIMRRPRGARNRQPSDDEEEEGYQNPVAPPPQVGLGLSNGGTLPSFTFHAQLVPNKSSTPPKHVTADLLSQQPPSSSPSFSFSNPTPISADSTLSANTPPKLVFGFSAPKPSLSTATTVSTPSLLKFTTALSDNNLTKQPPSKAPLPLIDTSVVEVLKKPAAKTLPVPKNISKPNDVVDLTASDDEDARKEKSAPFKLLKKFAPASGSWECNECLVNNKATDPTCVACTASKPGVEPQAGGLQIGSTKGLKSESPGAKLPAISAGIKPLPHLASQTNLWECTVCLVNNKQSDDECVACSAAKPGAKKDKPLKANEQPSKPPLFAGLVGTETADNNNLKAGITLSNTGGFKLGTGISLGGNSDGGLKLATGSLPPGGTKGFKLGPGVQLGKTTGPNSEGLKLGAGVSLANASSSTRGGFKLGSGLTLSKSSSSNPGAGSLLGASSSLKPLGALASPKDSWSCGTHMTVNKAEADICAAKPDKNKPSTPLSLGSSGGLKLGGVFLKPPEKPKDNAQPIVNLGTCDTCLVENKADVSACTTPKPFGKAVTKKDVNKTLPIGSFKLGGEITLGSLTGAANTPLTQATSTSSTVETSKQETLPSKPSIQFGVPSTSTSSAGFKLPANISFNSKPATDSPLANIKFGVQATTSSNLLAGIKLGGGPLTTTPVLGNTTQLTSSSSFALPTTNPLTIASTAFNPLVGIKLGGGPTSKGDTATTLTLTGNTLGGTLSTGTSPLQLSQRPTSTTASNPLSGIKLEGILTTTASSSPLAGIKLGGGLTMPASAPTAASGLQTQIQGLPKLSTNLTFGGSSTATLGTFNFTGAQKQEAGPPSTFQFSGATTSASSVFKLNAPSSSNYGLSFAPKFGVQQTQSLSLSTPARGDSNQAEMQSPDNEMTVESDSTQGPSLIFGETRPPELSALPTNIFSSQSNTNQNTSGFSFSGSTSNTFGENLTKPSFNFGSNPSQMSGFTFTGNQSSNPPNPSTQLTPGLMFTASQPTTVPQQSSTGFNFSANSGLNMNFGDIQQNTSNMFTASASTTTTGNRVIRKARRRKA